MANSSFETLSEVTITKAPMLLTDFSPDAVLNSAYQSESKEDQDFMSKMKNYWSSFTAYAQTTQGIIVVSTVGGILFLAVLLKVEHLKFQESSFFSVAATAFAQSQHTRRLIEREDGQRSTRLAIRKINQRNRGKIAESVGWRAWPIKSVNYQLYQDFVALLVSFNSTITQRLSITKKISRSIWENFSFLCL